MFESVDQLTDAQVDDLLRHRLGSALRLAHVWFLRSRPRENRNKMDAAVFSQRAECVPAISFCKSQAGKLDLRRHEPAGIELDFALKACGQLQAVSDHYEHRLFQFL